MAWWISLSSALDQRPGATIVSAEVDGPADDPAVDIAAGWLAHRRNVPGVRRADGSPTIPVDDDGQPTAPGASTVITLDQIGRSGPEILDHHRPGQHRNRHRYSGQPDPPPGR